MTKDEALLAALGHTQQIYRALAELSDLTTELEQATGQNDPVTVNLFLKLRAEPLGRAWEHKRQLRRLCAALPGEEGERLLQLLSDQAADPGPQEAPLLQQRRGAGYSVVGAGAVGDKIHQLVQRVHFYDLPEK